MAMAQQQHQVLASAKVIELLLYNPSLEDAQLRHSLAQLGAPPWVRTMGTCFMWRDACSGHPKRMKGHPRACRCYECLFGHLMFAVVPPIDPQVRLWDVDTPNAPTFEGPLSGLHLEGDDQRDVFRALFTTPAGCWADDDGNSVSLVLDP